MLKKSNSYSIFRYAWPVKSIFLLTLRQKLVKSLRGKIPPKYNSRFQHKAIFMKKLLSWGICFFLLSGMIAINANAGDSPIVLFAEGLNCPCKAEVSTPPPPPPSSPVTYYGGLELFGLTKHILDGGDNLASINNFSGDTLRTVGDATEKFDFGGARLTIGRMLNDRDSVEAAFMGFRHNSASLVTSSPEFLNAPFASGGFVTTDITSDEFESAFAQHLESDTRLISAEVNLRRKLTQMFSVFAGIRFAHLGDNLRFTNEDEPNSNIATLDIRGDNNLIGPQIGIDALIPIFDQLGIATGLKAGVFLNGSSIDTQVSDDDGNSFRFEDTDIRGSTVLDGNLALNWNPDPNINISLGYMMALFSWVTSAGENFPQANTQAEWEQHDSDHILVHGPMARVNLLFD
jgi:hypothetical protein